MLDYQLEHIFSYWATLAPPEVIGPVAEGIRANWYVKAGEVTGPRVRGKILPVGGDWLLVRSDGIAILDVRATVQTQDGALIYTTYSGVSDLGADGYQRFLQGTLEPVGQIRIAPRYHTTHPDYLWLNRIQCLGIGRVDLTQLRVVYDIYAVR